MKNKCQLLNPGLSLLALLAVGGCDGGDDGGGSQQPPADTTAPTVSSVEAPAGTVDRTVSLSVTASDNVGVTEVRFFVDGMLIGSDDTAPFAIEWDTSGETEGDHVLSAEAEDAAGNVAEAAEVTVTVRNMLQFAVELQGRQEVPPVETQATAQADLMVNLATGALEGALSIEGLTATAAHIHDAFAGTNGSVLVGLEQDPADATRFTVPAGATLDAAGVDRLLAGALYVNVHTDAHPGGELRGQILPEGFVLQFAELSGDQEAPRVETFARGRAAVTLDQETGAIVVQAQVEALDDASQAHVHQAFAGDNGPVLVPLSQDPMDAGHWFAEDAMLNEAGLAAFAAGSLYVNVHSPDYPDGEIRGQIVPDGITLTFVELSGLQEVPAVDTNAAGFAALTLDETDDLLTLHINTQGLDDASAAHLHAAFAGVNGPVEIGLTQDGSNPAHWFAAEQPLSAAQLEALQNGATYVNVHSPAHQGGEIRGQVIPDGILFAFGRLDGRQEVPPVETDAGGTFAVTADPNAGMLVAHVNTTGVDDATAAHLHDSYAGTNGSVAIGLSQDMENVARWSAVDAPVSAEQIDAIRAGRYYANVHTPAHPGGEIRGQLAPDPVEVLFTDMSGDEEVPQVATAAGGIAASTVNRETGAVTLHLNATGAADATASHIHTAYAGRNGGVLIGLEQDPADTGHWSVSGAEFDAEGLSDYLAGRLYVNLHTPANPGGEIRGQIAPRDIRIVFSPMDGDQVVPPVATAATGLVSTTADLESRQLVAVVNAEGVDDATSAAVHRGGIGENGPQVFVLEPVPMQPGQWLGVASLPRETFGAYRTGGLYAQIATPAQPDGEIRGQIVPADASEFDTLAPTVELVSPSPGISVLGTVTVEAEASDNQGVTEVRFLVDGTLIGSDTSAPYSLEWDTTTVADGEVTLTAEAEDTAGNVGISADLVVTVDNAVGVTLTQIQAEVFTPTCSVSGCHDGGGNTLPRSMNLTSTAESHAALVGVPSVQVPELDRVEPGDPDNSYLIIKLEGDDPRREGAQMPFGGAPLDQTTIDLIRQWIADGAPDN